MVDNSQFLCEHGHLVFDPNCPNDWDSSIAAVQMTEWTVLADLCVNTRMSLFGCLMNPIIGIPAALSSHWKRDWSKTRRTYLIPSSSMTSQCVMTVVRRGGYLLFSASVISPFPQRRSNYEFADITVRLLSGKNAHKDMMTQENTTHKSEESAHPPQTYGSHRTFGTRQSKRIRESKDTVEKKCITVSKSTTVKDIKVMVSGCPVRRS
jgi:ubiquitin carboxyl-terminal hydrolase 48